MMRTIRTFGTALLAANCLAASAWGADCVGPADLSALETAAMQQELMVAALSCHDVGRYNRFVLGHQPELIASDDRLRAFFVHRDALSGEASYHTFKTDLANTSSLRSLRDNSFCAEAGAAFDLSAQPMSLSAFVAVRPVPLDAAFLACRDGSRDAPRMADASAILPAPRAELSDDDADAPTRAAAAPEPEAAFNNRGSSAYGEEAHPSYRSAQTDYPRDDGDDPRQDRPATYEERAFYARQRDEPRWMRERDAEMQDDRYADDRYARDQDGDRPSDWRDAPSDDDRDDRGP